MEPVFNRLIRLVVSSNRFISANKLSDISSVKISQFGMYIQNLELNYASMFYKENVLLLFFLCYDDI